MNPTAIESIMGAVLWQWAIIIAVAWLFGRLGRRFGQPLAVGEIAAGLLLGPSVFGALWPAGFAAVFRPDTQQSLQLLGKIGLILLLFQVGMEFDFGHVRQRSRTVTAVSCLGIIAPFLGGLIIGPWLHDAFAPRTPFLGFQLFICIALSISSLPVMGRILLEMRLERTALAVMSISAAAIDDVAGWILLAAVTALVTSGFYWPALLGQLAGVAGLFLFLQYVVGPWMRRIWRRSRKSEDDAEMSVSFLALLLVVLFACALATNRLGIFSIFGAFLFGVALHQETSLVAAWRRKFSDFVLVALVPIFFTNTGLRTEIGSLSSPAAWLACGAVFLVAVGGKLGGCFLGARGTGHSWRESACIGALMNTRALMGLVAINVGADFGLLNREIFTMFVIMALATTAMAGPLLRLWLPAAERALVPGLDREPPSPSPRHAPAPELVK
jgi:Kef-type K+ transport system membrane component KefB